MLSAWLRIGRLNDGSQAKIGVIDERRGAVGQVIDAARGIVDPARSSVADRDRSGVWIRQCRRTNHIRRSVGVSVLDLWRSAADRAAVGLAVGGDLTERIVREGDLVDDTS